MLLKPVTTVGLLVGCDVVVDGFDVDVVVGEFVGGGCDT